MDKKVVVIGGGTGSYTVLLGLKKYDFDLTSIINVTDSGGSTGRLRDEFGYLPVGDFRMALTALADANGDSEILRELFLYRFNKGVGLQGHNFGNLLLIALTDILGNSQTAIEYASKILRVKGRVLPITDENITLIARYQNSHVIIGESNIDDPSPKHDGKQRIVRLQVQPKAQINKTAKKAILEADLIVLGPGDLYTSLLANLVVDGVSAAIKKSRAKVAFFVNLTNKYGQTHDFKASDYILELKKYLKKYPDHIFINKTTLPKTILKRYEQERSFPVKDDLATHATYKVHRLDLLAPKEIKKHSGDVVKRSLIRHDSEKIAKALSKLL